MPELFTPEQLKAMEALVAARVEKALAARPSNPASLPGTAQKTFSLDERKRMFKHAFGYELKAKILAQAVTSNSGVSPDLVKTMQSMAVSTQKAYEEAQKTILTPSIFAQGGALVRETYSDEIIEVLRDFTVVLQAGARQQSVDGKFNIGKLNVFAVAEFVEEGDEPTIPTPDTKMVTLDPKKLMGVSRVTRHMLMDPSLKGTETLSNDMLGALGTAADKHALVGNGTGPRPSGVYKQVASGQKFTQTAAFKLANLTSIIADLDKCERLVRESKIPFQGNNPGWVCTSRTLMVLKGLRDTAGWVFRQTLDGMTLNGYPVYVTDSISGQGAGGTDVMFFGLFSQLYYGMQGGLEVSMSDQQEFTKDNTFVKGVGYLDFKLRHQTAFAVIDGITYT